MCVCRLLVNLVFAHAVHSIFKVDTTFTIVFNFTLIRVETHLPVVCPITDTVQISIVTTIELSQPLRWLATIEPPPRWCTVFSAVFSAPFPENCRHYSAEQLYSL